MCIGAVISHIFTHKSFILNKYTQKIFLLFLALVAALLLYTRYRYMHLPLERDEGEYAYAGSLLLHNHLPYKDAYNMKFPGSYFMYALLMKAGGETVEGIRAGLIFIVLLTAFIIGAITKLLTKNNAAAALSAVAFIAFNNTMGCNGLLANAEHFVNLFSATGIYLLLRYRQNTGRWYLLFISGVSLALAVIMKQYGYTFCIFGLIILAFCLNKQPFLNRVKAVTFFAAGGIVPVALLLAWIFKNGLWQKFYFLTIQYAYAYIKIGTATGQATGIYWQIAALLVLILILQKKNIRLILCWLLFSLIAVGTGNYLRPHYYILVFPALAVAAGYACFLAGRRVNFLLPSIASVTAFGLFFIMHRQEQFTDAPISIYNKQFHGEFFADMPGIASHINTLIPGSDKLSIFSTEPELFFYSHHIAASGYIYSYPLFENQPYAQVMTEEFIKAVEANPSRLFVYTNTWATDNQKTYAYFENWWRNYKQKFYLQQVYYANTQTDGVYKTAAEIVTDSSYKKAAARVEFWMRKE